VKKIILIVAVLLATLACAHPGQAQIMDYNRWKIDVTPYFWLSGSNGDIVVDSTSVPVDVSFKDLVDFVSWGISGHVEARKRELALIFDVRYRDLDSQEEAMSTELRTTLAEASVGYTVMRLIEYDVVGDVIGGLRYFNARIAIRDAPNEPSAEENWVDPLVGGRIGWKPSETWTLSARGDIGGFGVGSDFSYNVGAVASWRVFDFSLIFGYRLWHSKYETGSGADQFKYDVTTHGPGVGMTFHFGGR